MAQESSTHNLRPQGYREAEPGWGCRFWKLIPGFTFDVWHPGIVYAIMKTREGVINSHVKASFWTNSIIPWLYQQQGLFWRRDGHGPLCWGDNGSFEDIISVNAEFSLCLSRVSHWLSKKITGVIKSSLGFLDRAHFHMLAHFEVYV